jgi:hypothetical protein
LFASIDMRVSITLGSDSFLVEKSRSRTIVAESDAGQAGHAHRFDSATMLIERSVARDGGAWRRGRFDSATMLIGRSAARAGGAWRARAMRRVAPRGGVDSATMRIESSGARDGGACVEGDGGACAEGALIRRQC